MNTQRVTVSLPNYLYQQLVKSVPRRGLSSFIAHALEEKVASLIFYKKKDPIEEFFALRDKLPIKKTRRQILNAIKKGRI